MTAPPAALGVGAFTRAERAGGRTPLAVWFMRPAASQPVAVDLTLTDPLGRVASRHVAVPAGPLGLPPSLRIADITALPTGTRVDLLTDAPSVAGPDGAYQLIVDVRRVGLFPGPGAHVEVLLPDIPDAADVPPDAAGAIVIGRIGVEGDRTRYAVLVARRGRSGSGRPCAAPDGSVGSVNQIVPVNI